MSERIYVVRVDWDAEATVWVTPKVKEIPRAQGCRVVRQGKLDIRRNALMSKSKGTSKKDKRKRDRERHYVSWFLNRVGWAADPIDGPDPPDFKIKMGDCNIGIEVTRIHIDDLADQAVKKGSEIRKRESEKEKALAQLCDHYYKSCDIPIRVQANMSRSTIHLDHVTDILCDIAKNLSEGEQERREIKTSVHESLLLYVRRLPDVPDLTKYSRWTCVDNHTGCVKDLRPGDLHFALNKKRKRLSSYRDNFDRIVLIIVADRTLSSGMLEWIEDNPMDSDSIGFDAIWLVIYPLRVIPLLLSNRHDKVTCTAGSPTSRIVAP
jgi:hypothetical protein